MSADATPSPQDPTPQETYALLQRILASVEKDQRSRWAEIACAVVLSLATVSTAWCAYPAIFVYVKRGEPHVCRR